MGLAAEQINAKIAVQELKHQVRSSNNSGTTIQTLYTSMQSELASGPDAMSYETIAKVLKPFENQKSCLFKIRSKLVPRDHTEIKEI